MARELNTLSVGFLAPHFAYVPYRINQARTGTATIELEYRGIQVAHTDTIEIVIYPPGDPSFISEAMDYATTWMPQHRCCCSCPSLREGGRKPPGVVASSRSR